MKHVLRTVVSRVVPTSERRAIGCEHEVAISLHLVPPPHDPAVSNRDDGAVVRTVTEDRPLIGMKRRSPQECPKRHPHRIVRHSKAPELARGRILRQLGRSREVLPIGALGRMHRQPSERDVPRMLPGRRGWGVGARRVGRGVPGLRIEPGVLGSAPAPARGTHEARDPDETTHRASVAGSADVAQPTPTQLADLTRGAPIGRGGGCSRGSRRTTVAEARRRFESP